MKKLEQLVAESHLSLPTPSANLLATLAFVLISGPVYSQNLSLNITDDLAPAIVQSSREVVLPEGDYSAYDQRQIEPLGDLGRQNQRSGEHRQALILFKQALHVARINNGLYHESQIPIIDNIIAAEISLRNWEGVNNYYAYQEHLYRRLYEMDDPRLELGLQKVSAWHINALNVNIDGRRIEHLRTANKLFKLRMQIAEHTLSLDHPKFAILAENIEICERELFLASDLNREMMLRKKKDSQTRRKPQRRSDSRLIVTRD